MNEDRRYNNNSQDDFLKNRRKRLNDPSRKPKNKKKKLKIVGIVLLIIILIIAGLFFYFKKIYKPNSLGSDSELSDSGIATELIDAETGAKISISQGKYTFLATGTDKSGNLTDVIMIVTYDMKNKSASMMQIPRDTYVKTNGKLVLDSNNSITSANFDSSANGSCKINAAFGKGKSFANDEIDRLASEAKGKSDSEIKQLCSKSFLNVTPEILKSYLNETDKTKKKEIYENIRKRFGVKYMSMLIYYNFGVPIDFYAQVNISGFRNIVDAIGGVDVVVQQDMNYDDPYQDLHIHLKAGEQHLDGDKAEQFVRFRHGYAQADIARIDAQKIFMTAFIKKMFSIKSVSKLDDVVGVIQKNLLTNLSASDSVFFATNAIDMKLSNIVMLTLPGVPQYKDGVSYYSASKANVREMVNQYLNKYDKPLPESSFCLTEISDKAVTVTTMSAGDIDSSNPKLGFVGGSKGNSSSASSQASEPVSEPSTPVVSEKVTEPQSADEPTTEVQTPADTETPSEVTVDEQTDKSEENSQNTSDEEQNSTETPSQETDTPTESVTTEPSTETVTE